MSDHKAQNNQLSQQEDQNPILEPDPQNNPQVLDQYQSQTSLNENNLNKDSESKSHKNNNNFDTKTERSLIRQQQLEQAYGGLRLSSQSRRQPAMRNTQSQQFFRTADQFDTKIVHDQVNRSTTKQLFTFSKAQRFTKPTKSYCQTPYYDSQLQSLLGQRGTTLGYGEKSDFTKTDKYRPGPNNYNIKSGFAMNNTVKGVKFAFGRSELEKQGLLGNMNSFPGPGSYNLPLSQSNIGCTIAERTSGNHIYNISTTPPPGAYDITGLNSKGIYYVGKYKGSGAAVFSPTSSHFYDSIREKRQPGPGSYNPPGDIKDANSFMPSQYLSQQGFQFGSGIRKTIQLPLLKTPGPGAYSVPSEFGDWDFPPVPIIRNQEQNSRFNKTDGFLTIKG